DFGSGTGIFSRSMARQGAIVTGVEPEKTLISQAVHQDRNEGINIEYVQSFAEQYEASPESVDIVTALRSWHWFDRSRVNDLVMKALRRDGYLIVIHAVFVPQQSQIATETIRVIKEYIPDLKPAGSMAESIERRNGLPVHWFDEWEACELRIVDEWQHDYDLEFTLDEWCGKVRSLSWLTNLRSDEKQPIMERLVEQLSDNQEPLIIPH